MFLYFISAFILHYKDQIIKASNDFGRLNKILFGLQSKRNIKILFYDRIAMQNYHAWSVLATIFMA